MKLVFASSTGLVFDVRSAVARTLGTDKRLRKLGLTSVCWLGALRLAVHFSRELTPAQLARVTKLVREARATTTTEIVVAA